MENACALCDRECGYLGDALHTKVPLEARFTRWTDEEKAVVRAATSCTDAVRRYRAAFPLSERGPRAAETMWYTLREKP